MKEKILYCALNWGLGHASRSTPIIKDLENQGHHITIASDGNSLILLQKEFPGLTFVELPSYNIEYKYESITLNILYQTRKFLSAVRQERLFVKDYVSKNGINKIISDNRFGCYDSSCHNIFITHQIRLIHTNPFIQAVGTKINKRLIEKFNECWIVDVEHENNLSGALSHDVSLNIPLTYIGEKSRFQQIRVNEKPIYRTLSILSGPEPQRTVFENILLEKLERIEGQHAIVKGCEYESTTIGNITLFGLLTHDELVTIISNSSHLISRSGYSSIMDFKAMNRKAILIPTPGQTEQEYLAKNIGKKTGHVFMEQSNIFLEQLFKK